MSNWNRVRYSSDGQGLRQAWQTSEPTSAQQTKSISGPATQAMKATRWMLMAVVLLFSRTGLFAAHRG